MLKLGDQPTPYPSYMLLRDCYQIFDSASHGKEVTCEEFQRALEKMVEGVDQDLVFQYWTNPSGDGVTPETQYGAGLRVQHDVTSSDFVEKHHTDRSDSRLVAMSSVTSVTQEDNVGKGMTKNFVGQMLKKECYANSPFAAGVMVLLAQRVPSMVLDETTIATQISVVSFASKRAK